MFACSHRAVKQSPSPPPATRQPSAGLPFPDARETYPWDAPAGDPDPGASSANAHGTDSLLGWSSPPVSARSASQTLPPVSRPEGVSQRPRPKNLPDKIRVLLSRGSHPLTVYSLGDMQIQAETGSPAAKPDPHPETVSKLGTLRGRLVIRRAGQGFEISQLGKVVKSTAARRIRLISVNPYNLIDVDGTVYRGSLHILGEADGGMEAVNVIGVEDYLRGVLPYELGSVDREALEALKALAVVARTYAYKRMMRAGNPDFHVYSDVQDQVYKGVKGEYLLSDRAVWETRGMAVFHGDSLALCYYFSTCGGRTASKHEVWGGDSIPYLVSRPDTDAVGDAYCQSSKYSSWKEEWSQPLLSAIVKRNIKSAGVTDYAPFSKVQALDVVTRATCGRIRVLKITTDKGPILVKGDKVRWALRPSAHEEKILPSAWFDVKMSGGKATAQGRAYGHGVGLCQVGAIARARVNQNFKQIIDAYYTDVQVVELR